MPDDNDRKLLDKRVVARYIKKGRLDEKDYDKHLKALPDLADQAVPVESDLDNDDLDDFDDTDEAEVTDAPLQVHPPVPPGVNGVEKGP
jgi:hypothetical protein